MIAPELAATSYNREQKSSKAVAPRDQGNLLSGVGQALVAARGGS
jgi:hypothetical protein